MKNTDIKYEQLMAELKYHLDDETYPEECEKCGNLIWTKVNESKKFCDRCGNVRYINDEEFEERKRFLIKDEKKDIIEAGIVSLIIQTIIVCSGFMIYFSLKNRILAFVFMVASILAFVSGLYLFLMYYKEAMERINKIEELKLK